MALIPRLNRPADDRVIAGVCSGIARYLNVETRLVRIVMALAVLFGGVGAWIYPVLWLVMPQQGSDRAPVDSLIGQAKEWNTANQARKQATEPSAAQPREVFNPYVDDQR